MSEKLKPQDKNQLSDIDENISKLFDIKKRLGKGAYGIVWKAVDRRTNETLAVKKIFDAFRDETDAQRTFREIVFLKAFRTHPNIIKLHNVFRASNNLDIYLIFEYMESDLHNIIKKGTILKDIHKRYVMYQLINAIKYIHSGNVIHRDLKPSNVLIDSKCRCKLADFGLARSVSNRPSRDCDLNMYPEPLLTDYVATRWYRAPEILVASKRYTKGIDMWSLGCILGEMIRGKPLFQGTSTVNQIEKIVSSMPNITDQDIKAVGADFGSVLLSKEICKEKKTSLTEILGEVSRDAFDLVNSLLLLDPLKRLTAKEALCHPYVEKFRNSIPEIELKVDILPPFRDDVRLSVPEYRAKLYEIVEMANEKDPHLQISNDNNKNREMNGYGDTVKPASKVQQQAPTANNNYLVPNAKSVETVSSSEKQMSGQPTNIYLTANILTNKTLEKHNLNVTHTKTHLKPVAKSVGSVGLPSIRSSMSLGKMKRSNSTVDESSSHKRNNNHAINYYNIVEEEHQHGDHAHNNINMKGRVIRGNSTVPQQFCNGDNPTDVIFKTGEGGPGRLFRGSSSLNKSEKCFNIQSHYDKEDGHRLKRSVHTISPTTSNHHRKHAEMNGKAQIRNTKSEMLPQKQHIDINCNVNNNTNSCPKFTTPAKETDHTNHTNQTNAREDNCKESTDNKSNVNINSNVGEPLKALKCEKDLERICYERRLRKLEAEIQRYKKEVKIFCRDAIHISSSSKHLVGCNRVPRSKSPALAGARIGNSVSQSAIMDEERVVVHQQALQQQQPYHLKQHQPQELITLNNNVNTFKTHCQLLGKGGGNSNASMQRKMQQQQFLPQPQRQEQLQHNFQPNVYKVSTNQHHLTASYLPPSHEKLPLNAAQYLEPQLKRRPYLMARSIPSKCL